eukprot:TRINITY_DN23528_c0_g7_i1.p1 TRINITY_DN23528_c0_g7~~TRINITY_DN23528_c0_g7_i1.p1  ORF type:complete len:933 (-),score=185.55 TRINITY_DN23528_c0_g7_i1:125-2923(-)
MVASAGSGSAPLAGAGAAAGAGTSLATEVLPLSGLLAQETGARDTGKYLFPVEDSEHRGRSSGTFALSRDDTLHLLGLLNSPETEVAARELASLLRRLDRPAVEGLTQRLLTALRTRVRELASLRRERGAGSNSAANRAALAAAAAQAEAAANGHATASETRPRSEEVTPRGVVRQQSGPTANRSSSVASLTTTSHEGMPQVFRRLTASRARPLPMEGLLQGTEAAEAALASSPSMPTVSGGSEATAYLEALLEARRSGGNGALTCARSCEDLEVAAAPAKRTPRAVSEEKAQEIFDRLYRSGKEQRVRRRVYQELGLLAEQAREEENGALDPARSPGSPPADNMVGGDAPPVSDAEVTERLYQQGLEWMRRREELAMAAPVPSFRPQTMTSSFAARPREGLTPTGSLASPHGPDPDELLGDISFEDADMRAQDPAALHGFVGDQRNELPAHHRLFREHAERQKRQNYREEMHAEWRQHSYRPDISASQANVRAPRDGSFFAGHSHSVGVLEDDFCSMHTLVPQASLAAAAAAAAAAQTQASNVDEVICYANAEDRNFPLEEADDPWAASAPGYSSDVGREARLVPSVAMTTVGNAVVNADDPPLAPREARPQSAVPAATAPVRRRYSSDRGGEGLHGGTSLVEAAEEAAPVAADEANYAAGANFGGRHAAPAPPAVAHGASTPHSSAAPTPITVVGAGSGVASPRTMLTPPRAGAAESQPVIGQLGRGMPASASAAVFGGHDPKGGGYAAPYVHRHASSPVAAHGPGGCSASVPAAPGAPTRWVSAGGVLGSDHSPHLASGASLAAPLSARDASRASLAIPGSPPQSSSATRALLSPRHVAVPAFAAPPPPFALRPAASAAVLPAAAPMAPAPVPLAPWPPAGVSPPPVVGRHGLALGAHGRFATNGVIMPTLAPPAAPVAALKPYAAARA